MKKIILACFLIMALLPGCLDITDSFKAGSFAKAEQFGATEEEAAMVEALTEKYGDLRETGEPRILEPMVTSNVDNFIPVDIVSKYSADTEKLYVWFVYDNFNEDTIEIEWVYVDNDYSIHTFESKAGDDFGRGVFILEMPDDGWPTGNYEVIIRGAGVEATVPFEIIDGATISTPIEYVDGKITLSKNPGWYLVREEAIIPDVDIAIRGEPLVSNLMGTSEKLYDYYSGIVDENLYEMKRWRTGDNGNTLAQGSVKITWTDPQEYVPAGQKISFSVNRVLGETDWGINQMSASFDSADINPGYGTSSSIKFANSNGESYFSGNYEGTLSTVSTLSKSSAGKEKAVIFSLGNGYGYKYYYEWME